MPTEKKPKPNYWWSMLTLKCPRCRRGEIFEHPNPYKKFSFRYMLDMHDKCSVCKQVYDLEPGFWFSTAYVSYGLFLVVTAITFLLWWLILGFSLDDNRIYYWLVFNSVLVVALQPFFMRLSRWLVLNFFVRYDENWETTKPVELR